MLPFRVGRCALPVIKTTFSNLCKPCTLRSALPLQQKLVQVENSKFSLPTKLLDPEKLHQLSCGSGNPAQRGHRNACRWKKRHPYFHRQWSLELKRERKGPPTPHFTDGVPFTQIRAFRQFARRGFKLKVGRRRKIRLSLKRGRRKLL